MGSAGTIPLNRSCRGWRMSAAREIIARHAFGPAGSADLCANRILRELTAAGYRILGPDELDTVTVERCERAIVKANERVPGIETPLMRGDNLAIILCSTFDDGERDTEDDSGWSQAARDGYNEVIKAIREHYAAALRAAGGRNG